MIKVTNEAEPIIVAAIDKFEKLSGEQVRWGCNLDFLPNPEEDENSFDWNLIPALGIYLDIPGPTENTVCSTSFYFTPYLIDEEDLDGVITRALQVLIDTKQREATANFDDLVEAVKLEEKPKRTRSRKSVSP